MLDGFIKKFVLCPECENPETELVSAFDVFVSKRRNHVAFVISPVIAPNHVVEKAERM